MVVFLNASVIVGAVFKNGNVFPRWFRYRGRKIDVQEVTYAWKETEGQSLFLHFSVTDGSNVYDLAFQPESLSWNLEAVEE